MTLRAHLSLAATSFAALLSSASAGDVLEVGPARPLATLSQALLAADAGDIVLVDPATYIEDLTITEGVAIIGRDGTPTIDGFIRVSGIRGTQSVLLQSLRVSPETAVDDPSSTPVLLIEGSRGAIRVRDSVIAEVPFSSPFGSTGRAASRVTASNNVVFSDCELVGSPGLPAGLFGVIAGGPGLSVDRLATVELSDTVLLGGNGVTSEQGGSGGPGAVVEPRGTLFAYGGSFTGGRGGDAFGVLAGNGGSGILTLSNVFAPGRSTLQGATTTGGLGGDSPFTGPGSDGSGRAGNGILVDLPGEPRRLDVPAVVRASDPGWSARTSSLEQGETAALFVGLLSGPRYSPAFERTLRVRIGVPDMIAFNPFPSDANGESTTTFGPTVPPAGEDGILGWTQSLCRTASGELRWSSSRATVFLSVGF